MSDIWSALDEMQAELQRQREDRLLQDIEIEQLRTTLQRLEAELRQLQETIRGLFAQPPKKGYSTGQRRPWLCGRLFNTS
jgi:predicted  nucleic acid-binding Zn-ribbon protein